jgi:hypothetical protein
LLGGIDLIPDRVEPLPVGFWVAGVEALRDPGEAPF